MTEEKRTENVEREKEIILVWPVVSDTGKSLISQPNIDLLKTHYFTQRDFGIPGNKYRKIQGLFAQTYLHKKDLENDECWGITPFSYNEQDISGWTRCYAEEQKIRTYASTMDRLSGCKPGYIMTDIDTTNLLERLVKELQQKRDSEIEMWKDSGVVVREMEIKEK